MKNDAIRPCFELTPPELENSELATLARKAGYASLKSMLNAGSAWSDTVLKVKNDLEEQIAQINSEIA